MRKPTFNEKGWGDKYRPVLVRFMRKEKLGGGGMVRKGRRDSRGVGKRKGGVPTVDQKKKEKPTPPPPPPNKKKKKKKKCVKDTPMEWREAASMEGVTGLQGRHYYRTGGGGKL